MSRLRRFVQESDDNASQEVQRGSFADFFHKPAYGSGEITTYAERGDEIAKGGNPFSLTALGVSPGGIVNVPAELLINGTIGGGEIDLYGYNLVAGQTYLFSVYGSGATPLGDTVLYLADGGLAIIDIDDDGGASTNSLLTYTATYTGLHVIGVGAFPGSGLTGQYTLDAVIQPPTDVVSDDPASATPITVGQVAYGFIEAGPGVIYGPNFSEVDTYSFTTQAGLFYTFEVAGGADYNSDWANLPPGELDTLLVIYRADGTIVATSDDISFPSDISSRAGFLADGGTYYLDVVSYQPYSGGFSITSSAVNPADFDPLDSVIWRRANNVPFDATNTAYVYFARPGESFGETNDAGTGPLPSLGWNEYEIGQVMLALEQYEAILGVNYEITDDPSLATFRLITTESQLYGAYFYPQDPAFGTQQGIGVFNTLSGGWNFDQQQSLEAGGYSFSVILHEFGHAHGLAHPHDRGGGSDIMLGVSGAIGSLGIYDLNQAVYTVMSYNDAWQLHPDGPSPYTAAGIDNGWTGTLSAFDIAALQQRYGVINPHATGNDVYLLRDTNDAGTYYQTIWDTGGRDVIRYDGARNARIDLLAATIDYSATGGGVLSFVDDIWGGFTIAQGVVIENATGGDGNDALLGNAASNVLMGRGGDDVLVGRGGGDTLNGGAGFDIASYIDASSGVCASLSNSNRGATGDAARDVFISIEGLQGSAHADNLTGNDGANRLEGLGGDDELEGKDGADVLLGGDGNDELDGGDGVDELDGGAGNDELEGGDGGDTLRGGAGNDRLYGEDGRDTLDGGAGNDRLSGGDSNDRLTGGAGDDILSGGDGRDTFVFNASSGIDTISDFRRSQDFIDLTSSGIVWANLDTSGNGRLDDADNFVTVTGGRTIIDLGAAAGSAAGIHVLTLIGATGLTQDNFII